MHRVDTQAQFQFTLKSKCESQGCSDPTCLYHQSTPKAAWECPSSSWKTLGPYSGPGDMFPWNHQYSATQVWSEREWWRWSSQGARTSASKSRCSHFMGGKMAWGVVLTCVHISFTLSFRPFNCSLTFSFFLLPCGAFWVISLETASSLLIHSSVPISHLTLQLTLSS